MFAGAKQQGQLHLVPPHSLFAIAEGNRRFPCFLWCTFLNRLCQTHSMLCFHLLQLMLHTTVPDKNPRIAPSAAPQGVMRWEQHSASRILSIISTRDPENSPEYSEFRYLCVNHWSNMLLPALAHSASQPNNGALHILFKGGRRPSAGCLTHSLLYSQSIVPASIATVQDPQRPTFLNCACAIGGSLLQFLLVSTCPTIVSPGNKSQRLSTSAHHSIGYR